MPDWLNKDTVSITATILGLVIGPAVLWWLSKHFARQAAVEDLARRLRDYTQDHADTHQVLDGRLAAGEREFMGVRAELSRLPQRGDMDKVEMGLATLSVEVATLRATMEAINVSLAGIRDGVQMLTNHELAQARGDRS